jgi:hypothetical protein
VKKFAQILEKVDKPKKYENIFIKAQWESPKHLHENPSKLLKYLKITISPLKKFPWAFK